MKPKLSRIRNPFAGYPQTVPLRDKSGGVAGYRIYARHGTPLLTKAADGTATTVTIGAMTGTFLTLLQSYPDSMEPLLAGGLAAALPIVRQGCRWLIRKTSVIEIRTDVIRINGWLGWKTYDRSMPHQFALVEHDKAKIEAEKNDLLDRKAQAKGRIKVWPKYYQESFHLALMLLGQRIDIASVYSLKNANAIRARLSACDAVMDGLRGTGEGPASDPWQQYRGGPGSIPLDDDA